MARVLNPVHPKPRGKWVFWICSRILFLGDGVRVGEVQIPKPSSGQLPGIAIGAASEAPSNQTPGEVCSGNGGFIEGHITQPPWVQTMSKVSPWAFL